MQNNWKELVDILKKKLGIDVSLLKAQLQDGIQKIFRKYIEQNSTFVSAIEGELLGELGLPMDRRMWMANEMVDLIGQGLEIRMSLSEANGIIAVEFDIIWSRDKMQELINRGEASYISTSGRPGLGGGMAKYQIPWLEWLLEGGSDVLISGFHIEYGEFEHSRTGMAVMKEGGEWSLPPGQYTSEDNFITESLNAARTEMIAYVLENLGE